jgi:isoquinoline 1-oxidoreductase beta subunit
MRPRFDARSLADSGTIDNAMDAALRSGRAHRLAEIGDPDALIGTKPSLASRYEVAPALHVTVETSTATARLIDGTLELWVATQAPEQARRAAARALKLAEADVVVYPLPAGGSFDRRLEQDVAVEAATIAREVGRPVQLVYSRHQETLRGWPRTPVIALLAAKTVSSGGIAAWRARLALPGTSHEFASRLFDLAGPFAAAVDNGERKDPLALEGAAPPYTIPNLAVDHVPVEIGLPTGRYRGNANGYTAFFTESFVDELAHLARREPLSFRIEMLAGDERLVGCLIAASRLGQWGGGGDASGQGVACHRIDDIAAPRKGGGRIAVIATARRDASGVRVDSLAAVADIGRIINLDIARQQIEGGLVYGLGMAMGGAAAYDRGIPESSRLASLDLPLMADCPRISVEFVDSDAPPFDPGELGAVAVAPAVANALFSATGLRFRRLPLLSEGL